MESNLSNSRVGVQIGEVIEGNEKTSVTLEVKFGKGNADAQMEEVKAMIGEEDANIAVVIALNCAADRKQELVELLNQTFSGAGSNRVSKDIGKAVQAGMISYKIIPTDDKVLVYIKPGGMAEELIQERINSLLGIGVGDLAENEQAYIKVSALSGIDFHDVLECHKNDETTLAAFMRNFKAEITTSVPQGSQLDQKILQILTLIHPYLANSPISLLQFIKTVDIDVSFRGIDEVPVELRSKLGYGPVLGRFPCSPKNKQDNEEFTFFKKIVHLVEPEINVYATLDKVAAVRLNVDLKGFGTAMINTQ